MQELCWLSIEAKWHSKFVINFKIAFLFISWWVAASTSTPMKLKIIELGSFEGKGKQEEWEKEKDLSRINRTFTEKRFWNYNTKINVQGCKTFETSGELHECFILIAQAISYESKWQFLTTQRWCLPITLGTFKSGLFSRKLWHSFKQLICKYKNHKIYKTSWCSYRPQE